MYINKKFMMSILLCMIGLCVSVERVQAAVCTQYNQAYTNLINKLKQNLTALEQSPSYQSPSAHQIVQSAGNAPYDHKAYAQCNMRLETIFSTVNNDPDMQKIGFSLQKQQAFYDWLKANLEEKVDIYPRWEYLTNADFNGCRNLGPSALAIANDGYFNRYLGAEAESNNNQTLHNSSGKDLIWVGAYANNGCFVSLLKNRIAHNKAQGKSTAILEKFLTDQGYKDRVQFTCTVNVLRNEGNKEYPEFLRDVMICMMEKMEDGLFKKVVNPVAGQSAYQGILMQLC